MMLLAYRHISNQLIFIYYVFNKIFPIKFLKKIKARALFYLCCNFWQLLQFIAINCNTNLKIIIYFIIII